MDIPLIVFIGLAAVAIGSALGMLMSRNAVYSALFLILNFLTIAVFYLVLGGVFIAMAQITVYAGAIMVLFLFVIMLLGAERLGEGPSLPWQRPLAIVLAVILVVETAFILSSRSAPLPPLDIPLTEFGSPQAIGELLFSEYLLPFEVTSVLLLIAMVGALILSRRVKS
ncbi:MAG: NADH-quinone oxidoreductase subunit J [Anaerolineales bacterium]|nr:NADH-quinone oxidoreductase subunit J [Anaerolineales bacterium]